MTFAPLGNLLVERERRRLAKQIARRYDWDYNARPSQKLPSGNWRTWLLMAGRGFGKTRTGAETIRIWVRQNPGAYINIISPTAADMRDVVIEGIGGVLSVCPDHERPIYESSKRSLNWPNGCKSLLFSAEEADRLRGPQCHKLWADELAVFPDLQNVWSMAMFGLRLGSSPQVLVTTTPKPNKFLKQLVLDPTTHVTRGTTFENRLNLADAFLGEIITRYEGTRLGRQELNAELLEDNPGALWKLEQINADRIDPAEFWAKIFPKLQRVVGAIDPAVTSNEDSDETGIVFVGRDNQSPPHFYVFDDRSCIDTPDGWARRAVAGYHQHKADRLVGEANNGGDMIEAVLRHVDPNVSFRKVHASRGKVARAEPAAACYEQHRCHHVGTFSKLEDQMCEYDPAVSAGSPDRMDALVWAMSELAVGGMHGLIQLWAKQAEAIKHPKEPASALAAQRENTVKPAVVTDACPVCGGARMHLAATFREPAMVRCSGCGLEGCDNEEQVVALLARRREEARSDSRLFKL